MPNTLIITRVGEGLFTHNLNGVQSAIDNKPNLTSFTGSTGTSFLDFKTKNGAPLIQNQQIMPSEITITDSFGGTGTQTGFPNVVAVWLRLGNLGYFEGFSGSSPVSAINTFKQLSDVYPNSFLGQNNKVWVVNEAENRLEPVEFFNYKFLTQLQDVSIPTLSANQVGKVVGVQNVNGVPKFTMVDPTSVAVGENLPEDFFISNTYNETDLGNKLTYITDIFRTINIRTYLPTDAYSTNHVVLVDNETIFIHGQLNATPVATGNLFGLLLKECKIINNVLTVGNSEYKEFPFINRNSSNIPFALHSCFKDRGYIYMLTRTSSSSTISQAVKINAYDLSDVTFKDIVYNGTSTNIIKYKNNIYAFMTQGLSLSASLIKFDENFNNLETIFTYDNTDNLNKVSSNYPFTIYNDEVYFATRWNETAGANKLGIVVYDLFTGALKRKANTGTLPADPAGGTFPVPHWIGVFNGKIIVGTASGTNLATSNKALARFDSQTLFLEQAISLPFSITNDNTIRRDGFIYLNSEFTTGTNAQLYKVKYNDFATFTGIGATGYYSLGSPVRQPYLETVKTKLSDFRNDLPSVSQSLQTAWDGGRDIITDGANISLLQETFDGLRNVFNISAGNSNLSRSTVISQVLDEITITNERFGNSTGNEIERATFRAISQFGPIMERFKSGFSTTVRISSPTVDTIINFPAKSAPGSYTLATTDDIINASTPLQTVLNAGKSATFIGGEALILEGIDNSRITTFLSKNNLTGASKREGSISVSNQATTMGMIKGDENYSVSLDENNGVSLNRANSTTGQSLRVSLPNPTNTATIQFPADKVGEQVVAMASDLTVKENTANKQNSLSADATNTKYPTVTAVNTGLSSLNTAIGLKANDADVLHKAGLETITDNKTFSLNKSLNFFSVNFGIGTPSGDGLQVFYAPNDRLRIGSMVSGTFVDQVLVQGSTGNVGIGFGDVPPTAKLDVSGNGKFSGDIEITDSSKGIILKDAGDSTRRRVTIVNGVLTVSAPL